MRSEKRNPLLPDLSRFIKQEILLFFPKIIFEIFSWNFLTLARLLHVYRCITEQRMMESNLTRAEVVRIITDAIGDMTCTELDGLVIDTSEHKYIVKSDDSEYGWCLESIKK